MGAPGEGTTETATILFTDVIGSTPLRARLGEEAADALRREHDALVIDAISGGGGRVVKGVGDGVMATFASASDAVAAAVSVQQRLAERNHYAAAPLEVRIGISAGDVSFEGGDCYGTPVIEAARLCVAATGGQVLAAELVQHLARGRGGHRFRSAGEVDLAGLPAPIAVAEVAWDRPPPSPRALLPSRLAITPTRGFVGRIEELAAVRRPIAAAAGAGAGPEVVLIAGEPGAGKTTLLAEVARQAYADGCAVTYGRGEEGMDTPYGLWRASLGDEWPSGFAEREDLFGAVLQAVGAIAAATPLVVVVDDLQWADRDSLLLLRRLVTARISPNLAVLAAYRSTEVRRGGPLAALLADLGREPGVERVAVGALSTRDVEALVARTIDAHMDEGARETARRLQGQSGGNAFFLSALLDEMAKGSAPSVVGSTTLREAIAQRVVRLGGDVEAVLRAGAIVGEVFTLDIVAATADLDDEVVLDALDRAVADGLLMEVHGEAGFAFVHALVADALLAALTAARRRQMHRLAAAALEAGGAEPAAIAHHLTAADPEDRPGRAAASDASLAAGMRALGQLAYEEAVARLRDAVGMIERWRLDDDRRSTAQLALGRALRRAGSPHEAAETLIATASLAATLGRWEDVTRAICSVPFLPTATPDPDRVAALERVADAAGDASAARGVALSLLSWMLRYSPPYDRTRQLAEEGATLAEESGERAARAFACTALFDARIADPDVATQLELGGSVLDLVSPDDDFAVEIEHAVRERRLHCHLRLADMAGVDVELHRVQVLAERLQRDDLRWSVLLWRSMRALLEGRLDDGERLALDAAGISGARGEVASFMFLMQTFVSAFLRGRVAGLAEPLTAAAGAFPHPATGVLLTAVLAAAGRTTEARAGLEELAADGFERLPHDDIALAAVPLLVDAGSSLVGSEQARNLYAWLDPYRGQCVVFTGWTGVCLGAFDRSLGRLARTFGAHDLAREHLDAAARLEARLGARPFLALTRVEQAGLGVPGAADEAHAIATALGIDLVLHRLDEIGTTPSNLAELRRDGDVWTVTYAGRTVQLKQLRGFEYLRELLSRPGRELHVVDLQGGPSSDSGAVLDDAAKRAYQKRLDEIGAQLEDADAFGDAELAARAAAQRQVLAEELARAVGLGGRDRKLASDAERARLNVTRALRLALDRVAAHHPELGRHLDLAVRTGMYCAYEPDPALPARWSV